MTPLTNGPLSAMRSTDATLYYPQHMFGNNKKGRKCVLNSSKIEAAVFEQSKKKEKKETTWCPCRAREKVSTIWVHVSNDIIWPRECLHDIELEKCTTSTFWKLTSHYRGCYIGLFKVFFNQGYCAVIVPFIYVAQNQDSFWLPLDFLHSRMTVVAQQGDVTMNSSGVSCIRVSKRFNM
ncbi:uncharacterized protein BYT42DRAFT_123894 [Radiomyces spectabilis]|uniref:uncharacterized protein n=1 Tax=Radiomyces spectabilis TaxID=64574 RepID=UPI00221FC110|nr:uncharacterized protein BYT42DRAFT_123894 [Radiomyces spectabilis]KAI8368246.1 hypothetical protein BYT42DRAFT_123894 [Radiomyces spectabilis]